MKKSIVLTVIMAILLIGQISAQGTDVSYQSGSNKMKGYFVKAKGNLKNAPGVLVLSAWMGINEHSKSYADKLGEMGYNAFVADIYGEGNNPKDMAGAAQLSGKYKNDYKEYQKRIKAGMDEMIKLGANASKTAVIGFCFGGTGALEAARAGMPILGVISFHGGLGKDVSRANSPISTKILALHGADDPYVPMNEVNGFVKEMNDGNADWQLIEYSGAVHAFTDKGAGNDNSKGAAYNEKAAKRSTEHMKVFLKEIFGV